MSDPVDIRPHSIVMGMLDAELVQERATTLGAKTRQFEACLKVFRELPDDSDVTTRNVVIRDLADALYALSVQREAIGLRDLDRLMKDYGVPPAMRAFMGASRS